MAAARVVVVAAASLLALGVGPATASQPLPLPARVLHAGDFLGFRPSGQARVVRQVRAWAAFSGRTQATLTQDGFVAGLHESLEWPARGLDGLSIVVEFTSARGAQHEVALYRSQYRSMSWVAVGGIPGAHELAGTGGENIVFASGPFQYLVGAGWSRGNTTHPTRSELTAAALTLYRRVHGRDTT